MSQRVSAILVSALLAIAIADTRAAEPGKTDLNELSMEVDALLALHKFDFTAAQLDAIRKWTSETAQKSGKRQEAKGNDKLRQTLMDLRAALVKMDRDEDQITELETRLTELKDADDVELDDDVEISDGARRRAPEALRLLTPAQVLAYLNEYADDIPDPMERLTEALEVAGDLNDADWKEFGEEVIDDLSWIIGGVDKKRAKAAAEQVARWLLQVRLAAKTRTLARQRPELDKAARQLVAQVPPTAVLHNFIERALAELLSNPRLATAIDGRSK
jgi:hypothetical protein